MIQVCSSSEKKAIGICDLMVQKKIFQPEYSIPWLCLWECIYFNTVRHTYIQSTPLQQSLVDLQVRH